MDRRTVAIATLLVFLVAVAGALFGLYLEGSLLALSPQSAAPVAGRPFHPAPC